MKNWKILNKLKTKSGKLKTDETIKIILENRGIRTKKEIEEFLHPKLEEVNVKSVKIDAKNLKKAILRVKKAIKNNETIVVYGDYDVDGICGTAILWETIYSFCKNVVPYIPDRFEEGYGLSKKGIESLKLKVENCGLIITVDNGIVANEAVEFANSQGIDVIITDHHVPGEKLPKAHAIVHTTQLCGTGVAYLLAKEIQNTKYEIQDIYLDLVALATVADLVPLKGANRTLVKFGLEALRNTKRLGLLELIKVAGIQKESIGTYEIGHILAPRLNAAGRLFSAMDSLRLICAKNVNKAQELALQLDKTNRERQLLTESTASHAKLASLQSTSKILFVHHNEYNEGIIGLVASRLVEEFYRPSFVVSIGEAISKGSARSIAGVNIIEMIRSVSGHIVQAGGHPMAAGFTVETARIEELRVALEKHAETLITDEHLRRTLTTDMELPFEQISHKLYMELAALSPFGLGNPEPTFVTRNAIIEDMRLVGKEGKHLKLRLSHCLDESTPHEHNCIAFGIGERVGEFSVGDTVDVVYTIAEDSWMNKRNGGNGKMLQLKIRDVKQSQKRTEVSRS